MKIVFLIRSLDCGGAERQLVLLAKDLSKKSIDVKVFTFYPGGFFRKELESSGIPVEDFRKKGRWDIFIFSIRLIKKLWSEKPDVLHGYLAEPNLMVLFFKLLRPRTKIVWGLRATNMDFKHYDWLSSLSFSLSRFCSIWVDLIVVNSNRGKIFFTAHHFSSRNLLVIQNGIDVSHYRPDRELRLKMRADWGIEDDQMLIGVVARFDPMKDHRNFIEAASLLVKSGKKAMFVFVGKGEGDYFDELLDFSRSLGLKEKIIWAGERRDTVAVYNALDILCLSSSFGEGFPNVVAESMACGVPCVVTDVGDAPEIVGECGVVVPVKNPQLLTSGIEALWRRLETEGSGLKENVRSRIVSRFNKELLIEKSMKAFSSLIQ